MRENEKSSSSRKKGNIKEDSPQNKNIVFKEGGRIEARDLIDNKWWTAKILEVDLGAGEVLLHFHGWNGRHDEWISMQSQRLRPSPPKKTRRGQDGEMGGGSSPHTPPRGVGGPPLIKQFKEGEQVMALWNKKQKYPAKIIRFEPDGNYLLEYYDGIRKKVAPKNIRNLTNEDTPFIKSCQEELLALKQTFENGDSAETGSGGRKRKAKFSVKEIFNIKSSGVPLKSPQNQPNNPKNDSTPPAAKSDAAAAKTPPASEKMPKRTVVKTLNGDDFHVDGEGGGKKSPEICDTTKKSEENSRAELAAAANNEADLTSQFANEVDIIGRPISPLFNRQKEGPSVASDTGSEGTPSEKENLPNASGVKRKADVLDQKSPNTEKSANLESRKRRKTPVDSPKKRRQPLTANDSKPAAAAAPPPPVTQIKNGPVTEKSTFPYLGIDFSLSKEELKKIVVEGVMYPGPGASIQLWASKLPKGWTKSVHVRTKGLSNGKWDVCVESPEGLKFRSKMELSRHIEDKNLELNIEDFDFLLDSSMKKIRNFWRLNIKDGEKSVEVASNQSEKSSTADEVHNQSINTKPTNDKAATNLPNHKLTPITDKATSVSTSKVTSLPGHQPLLRPSTVRPTPPPPPATVQPSPQNSRASNVLGQTPNSRRSGASILAMEETSKFPAAGSNGVRCNIPECNKLFRNGTLLFQHVKHYHAEIAQHVEQFLGNSPTVTDLAYLRTRVADFKQELESDVMFLLECIKKAKQKYDKLSKKNNSEKSTPKSSRSRLSRRSTARSTSSADELAAQVSSSTTSHQKSDNFSFKNGDLLVEAKKSRKISFKENSLAEVDSKTAAGTSSTSKSTPPAATNSKSTPTTSVEETSTSAALPLTTPSKVVPDESIPCTPTLTSAATTTPSAVTPPTWKRRLPGSARHSPPEKPTAATASTPSASRPAEKGVETLTEEELVQCVCGRFDGDGLMVQCEVCLSWQHGHCTGYMTETQVPDNYICSTCLDPAWGRTSTKFSVPLHWGAPKHSLPRLVQQPAAGRKNAGTSHELDRLEQLGRLMNQLAGLAGVLHSLRIKLHVAQQSNHPKVFMWSSPWESAPSPPPTHFDMFSTQGDRQTDKCETEDMLGKLIADVMKNNNLHLSAAENQGASSSSSSSHKKHVTFNTCDDDDDTNLDKHVTDTTTTTSNNDSEYAGSWSASSQYNQSSIRTSVDSETSLSTLEEGSCAGTPLEGEGEPAAASTAAAADFAAPDFFDFDEVKQLLPGVLQDISKSLTGAAQGPPNPTYPAIPQPPKLIDREECRLNLVIHLENIQDKVANLLDKLEAQVTNLEKCYLSQNNKDDDDGGMVQPGQVATVIQKLARDVASIQRACHAICKSKS